MPGMPDKNKPKQNGHSNGSTKKKEATQGVDIKALEHRILSSTEHLNDILALSSLLSVASLKSTYADC
jgi:hypothetical protein